MFLVFCRLHPSSPTHEDWEREQLAEGRIGWVRSQTIVWRESLVLYKLCIRGTYGTKLCRLPKNTWPLHNRYVAFNQFSCIQHLTHQHFLRAGTAWTGRFQMQGGKKSIFPKEMNANRFFWDSHWLDIWSNHFCPCMGPDGSVAMDSGPLPSEYEMKPVFMALYCVFSTV